MQQIEINSILPYTEVRGNKETAILHINFFALNVLHKLHLVSWTIYSYITLKYPY